MRGIFKIENAFKVEKCVDTIRLYNLIHPSRSRRSRVKGLCDAPLRFRKKMDLIFKRLHTFVICVNSAAQSFFLILKEFCT